MRKSYLLLAALVVSIGVFNQSVLAQSSSLTYAEPVRQYARLLSACLYYQNVMSCNQASYILGTLRVRCRIDNDRQACAAVNAINSGRRRFVGF